MPTEQPGVAPAYDGQNHGQLMSRAPFIAHYGSNASSKTVHSYESDSSLERVWEDGFRDYECPLCGRIFGSARGAGSHRQYHIKSGEIEPSVQAAWERAVNKGTATMGTDKRRERLPRRTKKELAEEVIPHFSDLVFEEPPAEVEPEVEPESEAEPEVVVDFDFEPEDVIGQIAALVSPQIIAARNMWKQEADARQEKIDQLTNELAVATRELNQLRSDWDALRGLIDGR